MDPLGWPTVYWYIIITSLSTDPSFLSLPFHFEASNFHSDQFLINPKQISEFVAYLYYTKLNKNHW